MREVFRDAARFSTGPAGFADQMVAALDDPDSHRPLTLPAARHDAADPDARHYRNFGFLPHVIAKSFFTAKSSRTYSTRTLHLK